MPEEEGSIVRNVPSELGGQKAALLSQGYLKVETAA